MIRNFSLVSRLALALSALGGIVASASAQERTADEQRALELYRNIIAFKSTAEHGETPALAAYISEQLQSAGFSASDIEIVPMDGTVGLIARYQGDGRSGKAPILFLAHMDVVEADPKDWDTDPFELREEDGFFIGRGTADNKYGVTNLTQTFIRLKEDGFVPSRDLILVFTGDEETEMVTTRYLASERPDLQEAEFVLNSDAGGGAFLEDGTALPYYIQAAEKTYATFEITATNPGGHSSAPKPDNAIYDLADAVLKIQTYQFPVKSNEITRQAMASAGPGIGGDIGEAMVKFAQDPSNKKAIKTLRSDYRYSHQLSTTCVTTMLDAGHAENALPQSAMATVNCRIFPGTEIEAVRETLVDVIDNDALTVEPARDNYVASPVSPLRDDVIGAVQASLDATYPGMTIIPGMSSGGTDGMHFRRAGIPTYGVGAGFGTSGVSVNAHGLNEKVEVKYFYEGLDHWFPIIQALAGDGTSTAEK